MNSPYRASLNGWFGALAHSDAQLSNVFTHWLGKNVANRVDAKLLFEVQAEKWDWHNPHIGWSLLLPHRDGETDSILATPFDTPEPIQKLWAERGSPPIYRFDPQSHERTGYLRRHSLNGVKAQDLDDAATAFGIGEDKIPYYLLIFGGPNEIPWSLQRRLNANRAVGRLFDFGKDGLENYVTALLREWKGSNCRPWNPVIWCTGHDRVTNVMWRAVGEQLYNEYQKNSGGDLQNGKYHVNGDATITRLVRTLEETRPGLVVTTSHGFMDSDHAEIKERVGSPVDNAGDVLLSERLLENWQPDGAIWLSVACCSAGTDQPNGFDGLLDKKSTAHQSLQAIAKTIGRSIAPLPQLLLGAKKPLRAFVGHVEPTFDRVMFDSVTHQYLANGLVEAFSRRLYQSQPRPIGYCLRPHFRPLGGLYDQDREAEKKVNADEAGALEKLLDIRLRQRDLGNMMILGDPVVAIGKP